MSLALSNYRHVHFYPRLPVLHILSWLFGYALHLEESVGILPWEKSRSSNRTKRVVTYCLYRNNLIRWDNFDELFSRDQQWTRWNPQEAHSFPLLLLLSSIVRSRRSVDDDRRWLTMNFSPRPLFKDRLKSKTRSVIFQKYSVEVDSADH